jgi:hypothetical protein
LYQRILNPPYPLTLDAHALKTFDLFEALLFDRQEDIPDVPILSLGTELKNVLDHLRERGLVRAMRLILLMQVFKKAFPGRPVPSTQNSVLGSVYSVLEWLNGFQNNGRGFLFWLYVLSLGIGLFNLLPLPIVDGGRMLQTALKRAYGEQQGNLFYGKVSLAVFILLIASMLLPVII